MFVDPIKDLKAIKRIKTNLQSHPRNYALFVLGINTAFRAGDLLSIKYNQVNNLSVGDDIMIKEQKTGKLRRVSINQIALEALRTYLDSRSFNDDDYIFQGQRGVLTVSYVNYMVKQWCREAGIKGHFGSHSLRKTWGYHQRITFKSNIEHLMFALNHSSARQTLQYLCIQPDEIKTVYMNTL